MNTTEKPTIQNFHLDGVKHIIPSEAFKLVQNKEAVIVDVREMGEVEIETIPLENVLYHPMSVIMDRLPNIAKDQKIILVCPGGVRSTKVAYLLNRQGYPDVANLDGGLMSWREQGLPIEFNISYSAGCGCGCNTASSENKDCSSC